MMVPVIEQKSASGEVVHQLCVRADLADKVLVCTGCKGTGNRWQRAGGDLLLLGWDIHQPFRCPTCGGAGYWINRAA